ncbi:hypothetical protein KJ934_00260 [Patescibacteria group bacterium]|nr:hypothetical protein [Patescibacteria group bacterium]MBU4353375.1 hypothetical protein [Patescibacteria group bacterium]MBU4477448.1 hypothetical protein [Patescibacteria group bacterium]MCG2699121.1 hypothetical protein [Candidatus Parcubacteria bacterium]
MLLLEKFAEAIKTHEGWFAGSRSQKNHNPGNLKFANQFKATGRDPDGFAVFANDDDGWEALIKQIKIGLTGKSKLYYPEMTILQFFERYAPSADHNNPGAYAQFVAQHCGLKIIDPIKILSEDELADSASPVPAKPKKLDIFIDGILVFSQDV